MIQKSKSVSPMSNEGRNAYVIEHINEALLGLLKEKSLNEISISEICETAGVGRMSFYRNYESKEDVIKKQLLQLIQEWEKDYEGKKDTYALVQELANQFKAETGSIICRELLGLDGKDNSPVPSKRTEEYYKKRTCEDKVGLAAKILDEYIQSHCTR